MTMLSLHIYKSSSINHELHICKGKIITLTHTALQEHTTHHRVIKMTLLFFSPNRIVNPKMSTYFSSRPIEYFRFENLRRHFADSSAVHRETK